MSKQKRFEPPAGFIVAVHQNMFGCKAVAQALDLQPVKVAQALEQAGFMLVADPMDISADTAKVINLSERSGVKLEVVPDESDRDAAND